MKTSSMRYVCVGAFLTLLSAGSAAAQSLSQRFEIPFQFHVGKQVLVPGTYSFIQRAGSPRLEIQDGSKKTVASLNVITRTARTGAEKAGRLVFDKEGTERFLSELWPTGADGLVLRAVQGDHQHESVEAAAR